MNNFRFSSIARRIAVLSGRPAAFLVALSAVVLWGLGGPLFDYSNTPRLCRSSSTS